MNINDLDLYPSALLTDHEQKELAELREREGTWDFADVMKVMAIVNAIYQRQEEALCVIDRALAEEIHSQ